MRFDPDHISANDIEAIGLLGSPETWDFVMDCIKSGKRDFGKAISRKPPMKSKEELMKAFDIMQPRKDNIYKTVLLP